MSLLDDINNNVQLVGNFSAGNEVNINSAELQNISIKLKEAIDELVAADKEERLAWEEAKACLRSNLAWPLKSVFEKTDNEYYNAVFTLNRYRTSLDRISNIWGTAEERILKAIRVAESSNE